MKYGRLYNSKLISVEDRISNDITSKFDTHTRFIILILFASTYDIICSVENKIREIVYLFDLAP